MKVYLHLWGGSRTHSIHVLQLWLLCHIIEPTSPLKIVIHNNKVGAWLISLWKQCYWLCTSWANVRCNLAVMLRVMGHGLLELLRGPIRCISKARHSLGCRGSFHPVPKGRTPLTHRIEPPNWTKSCWTLNWGMTCLCPVLKEDLPGPGTGKGPVWILR